MKKRCRCCLTTSAKAFYNIFEEHKSGSTYAENIRFLAEVQIEQNDGLSQEICSNCYDEIQHIYEFSLKVRQADQKLRLELEATKNGAEVDQMENIQILASEYFAPVEDNGMQVCVMEEILEQESDPQNVLIVEEIHDMEEINIVEEVINPVKERVIKSYIKKESLLEDLAQVAASQENVNIENESVCSDTYHPDDENDEDYLIEFDPNETINFKPNKWKCGECKVVLRGDVSYEGHMNLHRKVRPHECNQCQTKYRCRTALKRHKDLKHYLPTKQTLLCIICSKSFYSEIIFYLHQAIVHRQGEKCPFECKELYEDNIKEHLESMHHNEMMHRHVADIFYSNDKNVSCTFQCFRCSEIFQGFSLLQDHVKSCQTFENKRFHYDNSNDNENIIEIVKVEETEISVQCSICRKNLLKRNLNKHMQLHKRKEQEEKELDETKSYLCAFCPREFKNSKSLHQHEKVQHGEDSDIVYVCADCERQYASQYLLETHRKQAHKERDNICTICGNAFKLRNQLVNHMKLHLKKNIPCPHCDKKYARQFDLNVHLRSHTGEQPYACHLCEKRFAIKVRLTYHLQKHYGIKHYCKECGAEFNSKQKLKAHSFKHTGMPYRCQMCDDHGFATRNTFTRHLTRVHHTSISEEALNDMFQKNTGKSVKIKQIDDQKILLTASEDDNQEEIEVLGKYNSFGDKNDLDEHLSPEWCQSYIVCVECNKNFTDLTLLEKHKRELHKEAYRYTCKECGNMFGGRAQLSAHKKLHKERPFKCDQCDKAYPRRVELEIHMRTHTGELPYECHLCDKRFAIKVRLTYHLQKHEGITHNCTYCSAVYDSRNKLKAHLFKHTGMPYKCEFCPGLGFERRIRFANHMKRVHQKILSEEELTQIFARNTGKTVRFKKSAS